MGRSDMYFRISSQIFKVIFLFDPYPYAPKTTPRATPETQLQAYEFCKKSIIGKAARSSDQQWNRIKKKVAFIDHSPVKMSGKINRTHDVQWRTLKQFRNVGIEPSSNSSKSGT